MWNGIKKDLLKKYDMEDTEEALRCMWRVFSKEY